MSIGSGSTPARDQIHTNKKSGSLKEKRQREKCRQRNLGGVLGFSWHFKLCWLYFHTGLNVAAINESTLYFFFFFFFYKIILNLFQQAVWVIQFCYELTKLHHQPMTDLAFLSLQCKAWVQAAAAFMSKVRHAKGKSSSTKIKTWPLFLQSRVTHQETHSLVTFLNEEPFIPLGRYVRSLEPDTLSSDLICSHRLIWSRLDQN